MKLVDYFWDHPDLKPFAHSYEKGDFLFHQNDEGDAMYIVQRGAIELVVEKGDNVLVVGYEDSGKFIGEKAIAGAERFRRAFGARALTELTCLVLRLEDVEALQKKNPPLMMDLLKRMFLIAAERLDAANRLAELLRSSHNVDRFVRLVLHFANFKEGRRSAVDKARVQLNIERVRHFIDMGDHEIETCFEVLEKRAILVPEGNGIFLLKNEKALLQSTELLREALPQLTVI